MNRLVGRILFPIFLVSFGVVVLASAQSSPAAPAVTLSQALEAVEQASLHHARAFRLQSEKTIAVRSAAATIEALTEATRKSGEARTAAERVGASDSKAVAETFAAGLEPQLKAARLTLDKVTAERVAADKALQAATQGLQQANQQLATARAPFEKVAADASKAMMDVVIAREAAATVVVQKTTQAAQATNALNVSQAAASRAEQERIAAEKALATRLVAVTQAQERLRGLQGAVAKAEAEKQAAGQAWNEKVAAAQAATRSAGSGKDQAGGITPNASIVAALAARKAAETTLAEKSAKAKEASTRAEAARVTAAQRRDQQAETARLLAQKTEASKAAAEKCMATKVQADKLAAEKQAAEADLAAKTVAERHPRHKAAEAWALAQGGLKVLPESAWDLAKARHLLVRAGFGGTPEQVARLHEMGLVQAVNSLVDYQAQPVADDWFRADVPERPLPTENQLSAPERERLNQRRDARRYQDFQHLRTWWMKRLVESPRPLQEKMTLFWHGHFVSDWEKLQWPHLLYGQNELFRRYAAGNFGSLLYGVVHDPATIVYLDNQINYKGRPNQNLARELMELFSMGVNQGYTEFDIREGARALTGYTYEPYSGQFRFNLSQHDSDPKTIFGKTGPWTGDDFVRLILEQPHTARFIAAKLYEFFAASDPDPAVVTHLAVVLRGNGYEVAPLLKNLFMSEAFYSPQVMGGQIKSPVQLAVGFLRDLGASSADYNPLIGNCAAMGQELFQPPNVKGWYGGHDWINANLIFRRHNFTAWLVHSTPHHDGRRGIELVDLIEKAGCSTAEQVVDHFVRRFLVVPPTQDQRKELVTFLGKLPPSAEWAKQRDALNARFRNLLALLLTLPGYQLT